MTTKYVVAVFLIFVLASCKPAPQETTTSASAETPVKITACQLMTDPAAYDHKLVEVSGDVSVGFEDFAIYAHDECAARNMIWLDLGGSADPGTMYCCGDHRRDVPLMVEGVMTPLVDDAKTRRFVKVVQTGHAGGPSTLIGHFFSGKPSRLPDRTIWGGYGHMGCCSLLVIQQVLD